MKIKSILAAHLPLIISSLIWTPGCSSDGGDDAQSTMGSVSDRGAGGSAGASASAAGSGGARPNLATGGPASGEGGGPTGIALGGSNGSISGAQNGSAGSGAGGAGGTGDGADAGAADAGEALVTYTEDIQPILVAQCSPCHATLDSGGHNAATSYADAVREAADIVREIRTGGMPESGRGNQGCNGGDPGDPGCVSAEDFELIQSWVAAGTPE